MPERTKRFLAVGLVGVLVMVVAGVFAAAKTPTTTLPSPTPTLLPTNTATMVVAAATPLASNTPITVEIQKTPIQTPTPAPIPLNSGPFLTSHKPTFAELEAYLIDREISYEADWGQGSIVLGRLSPDLRLVYEDLNGDNEADMMIWQHIPTDVHGILLVMLWDKDHYLHPLAVYSYGEYGGPGYHLTFADWTGDLTPEIVLDTSDVNSGAGLHIITWLRYLIHCQAQCEIVWSGELGKLSVVNGSRAIQQTSLERQTTENGQSTFTITRSGFSSPHLLAHYLQEQIAVFPEMLETWIWNGSRFALSNEQVIAEGYKTSFQPVLSATNNAGDTALLLAEPDKREQTQSSLINTCTFTLNGAVLTEQFYCASHLAWVSWQDITEDGRADLILIATDIFSGQRLLAYDWDGIKAKLIADLTGEIISADLYGVRIENVDEDNAGEILAGYVEISLTCESVVIYSGEIIENCWYQPLKLSTEIFDWNKTVYAYLSRGRVP